jgi:hypothetical protein
MMVRFVGLSGATLVAAAMLAFTGIAIDAVPADAAVVYCKTAGVPKGCVARHTVVRPVVHRHVVYCKTRGVPKGCVMR